MRGFFPAAAPVRLPLPLHANCAECRLDQGCQSPRMPVAGEGRRKILICGEAPGKFEDESGIPFVGKTGQHLQSVLRSNGVEMFRDCFITNAARCRPKDNTLPERAVDYCRPFLVEAIRELQPEVVIPLGSAAVWSLIGWLWREDAGGISRWAGWRIPCQKINAWIAPTYHPSHVLRSLGDRKPDPVPGVLFARHLRRALRLQGRPWPDGAPDWSKAVRPILDPDEAAAEVRRITAGAEARGAPVAFDIETDRIKPDAADACIWSASLSDGVTTISFPWVGQAIRATEEFLISDVPKIGYNCRFETRFFQARRGLQIRNWCWDGMIAAHVLDNRGSVTSLKFQAFALLGQGSYDEAVKPFFKSPSPNAPNRIRELDLRTLLVYGSLDALLEFKVAQVQARQLGIGLGNGRGRAADPDRGPRA